MSAAPEYYINRPLPANETQVAKDVLSGLVDQALGDVLSGATTSRVLKIFYQPFGPVSTANEIQTAINRDGDYVCAGEARGISDAPFRNGDVYGSEYS